MATDRNNKSDRTLEDVFADDPLGILDTDPESPKQSPAESTILRHFKEVCEFVDKHGREPSLAADDMAEFRMATYLQGIQNKAGPNSELRDSDRHGLLKIKPHDAAECLNLMGAELVDELELLDDGSDDSIFSLRNVRPSDRINPVVIERRRRCADFDRYRDGFEAVKNELRSGLRVRRMFREEDLMPGRYFCLNGIVMLLEGLDVAEQKFEFNSGDRIRLEGHIHAIFDNGTESNMLYRSLLKALSIPGEGYSISERIDCNMESHQSLESGDRLRGHLYVLRSLSDDPKIKAAGNLYKIGYSVNTVEERIRNAEHESTYLRAPVLIVRDAEVYNMDAHDFESRVHSFFRFSNPAITIVGEDGQLHAPKEWFVAPLEIIDRAIELLASGGDAGLHYDPGTQSIVEG